MKNTTIATTRTTVNAAWVIALIVLATRIFGWHIELDDPVVIGIVPAVTIFFYRLSVVLSENIPWIGYLIFGVNRSPGYSDPPPDAPVVSDPPPVDAPVDTGIIPVQEILTVLAAIVLVLVAIWLIGGII